MLMRFFLLLVSILLSAAPPQAILECTGVKQWGEARYRLTFRTGPAAGWKVAKAQLVLEAQVRRGAVWIGPHRATLKVQARAAEGGFATVEVPPGLAEDLLAGKIQSLSVRGFHSVGRRSFLTVEGVAPR